MNRWSTEDFQGSENILYDAITVDTHHYCCCCLVTKLCFCHPRTAAHQASLSFTISQSLLKIMPIELVMPSNHLILCSSLLFLPSIFSSIWVFSNESVLHIRWPKYWKSASVSVLPMNLQCLYPLQLTGLISLQFKRLLRVFSNTTGQKHQFFSGQLSLWSNSHSHP